MLDDWKTKVSRIALALSSISILAMIYLRVVEVVNKPGPLVLGISVFTGLAAIPAALISLPRRLAIISVLLILICSYLTLFVDSPFYWVT